MHFKIDWTNFIVERKFTIFALLYFVLEGNFQVETPGGGGTYIWRGDLTEGFLHCKFGGLIFGGAYFRNFSVPKNDKITAFCQTKYVLEALHQSLPITKMNFEKLLHKANKFSKTTINCNSF